MPSLLVFPTEPQRGFSSTLPPPRGRSDCFRASGDHSSLPIPTRSLESSSSLHVTGIKPRVLLFSLMWSYSAACPGPPLPWALYLFPPDLPSTPFMQLPCAHMPHSQKSSLQILPNYSHSPHSQCFLQSPCSYLTPTVYTGLLHLQTIANKIGRLWGLCLERREEVILQTLAEGDRVARSHPWGPVGVSPAQTAVLVTK